jgi:hypothetical protein
MEMSENDTNVVRTLTWLFAGLFGFLVLAIMLARAIVY